MVTHYILHYTYIYIIMWICCAWSRDSLLPCVRACVRTYIPAHIFGRCVRISGSHAPTSTMILYIYIYICIYTHLRTGPLWCASGPGPDPAGSAVSTPVILYIYIYIYNGVGREGGERPWEKRREDGEGSERTKEREWSRRNPNTVFIYIPYNITVLYT